MAKRSPPSTPSSSSEKELCWQCRYVWGGLNSELLKERVPAVVYWLRRPAHKRSRPIPKHERNDAIKSLRLAMELDWYGVPPTGHGLTARGCGGRWSSSDAAKLPMRCRITLPPEDRQPQSTDPEVSSQWSLSRRREGYDRVIASWRAQRPRAVVHDPAIERQPVEDFSEDD